MFSVHYRPIALALSIVTAPTWAHAAALDFFGRDPGPGETTRLADTPEADQARAAFREHIGSGRIESFEGFSDGTFAWTQQSDGTWTQGRELAFSGRFGPTAAPVTTTLTAFLGTVVETPAGTNGYGRYPTHGDKFFHSTANRVSLEFHDPIRAFGFDLVDLGDYTGDMVIDVYRGDMLLHAYTIAHAEAGAGGDVQFGGIVAEYFEPFTKVVFRNATADDNVFAIDHLIAGGATVVPVPAALPLLGTGIAALAWLRRRRG